MDYIVINIMQKNIINPNISINKNENGTLLGYSDT